MGRLESSILDIPSPRRSSQEDANWFRRQMQEEGQKKTAKRFVERVSGGAYEDVKFNAEELAKKQIRLGIKHGGEVGLLDDSNKMNYRQNALQFLEHYQDDVTFSAPGIDIDKLIDFAVRVINNTMELEDEFPSKGLEHFLTRKGVVPKKLAA